MPSIEVLEWLSWIGMGLVVAPSLCCPRMVVPGLAMGVGFFLDILLLQCLK